MANEIGPHNVRLGPVQDTGLGAAAMPEVETVDDGKDVPTVDDKGNVIQIEHPDGSITISLDGKPIEKAEDEEDDSSWFANLVNKIDKDELSRISNDLIRGIDEDISTRKEWMENVTQGIKLLGLKIELPNTQGAVDGAPVEGMSKIRSPILLEAILRFQANARSEMLPTDGPVKIRNDSNNSASADDELAEHYERDFNHYLTVTADEYYPDTDRMLFMFGFEGIAVKKIYFCPVRNRPVSEMVEIEDFIVSNNTTSLKSAKRITHRIMMSPNTVRRMQIIGVYRDIELGTPQPVPTSPVKEEKDSVQGVSSSTTHSEDRDREIYECCCELNIKGFEHKKKGKETGLEIPYRVTIDASSKEILSVTRNYDEVTKELPIARQGYVVYVFVPGLGFYPIGLLHILGNVTNAVTAAWRELLDAGMYASFPGFLYSDAGGRQNTNIFRVPPGGGAQIKTGGQSISQAVMPLPYKEPSQALFQMGEHISQYGQRLGGTSEMPVGEGNLEAPVGTTIALIEQATKMLNAVHKRMHSAQSLEFQLIAKCFREHPESFWQYNDRPSRKWDEETFRKAVDNYDLIPQADPNTSSHIHRLMKVTALKQLQTTNPTMYNTMAVDAAVLKAAGWDNPQEFMVQPDPNTPPPPEVQEKMEELKIKKQEANTHELVGKAKAASLMQGEQGGVAGPPTTEQQIRMAEIETEREDIAAKTQDSLLDAVNRKRDRESRERVATVKLAEDLADNPGGLGMVKKFVKPDMLQRLEGNEPNLPNGLS